MKKFLRALHTRNPLLYWFGWFNFFVAGVCLLLIPIDHFQLLGVSRWLKPMKFYLSVAAMTWTMGWLMHYLGNGKKVMCFSWLILVTLLIENGLILLQAARKTTSHFNGRSFFDWMVFQLMGIFIVIFTLTCIVITIEFFKQHAFNIPATYLWSIRLGLILFILFSIEGGLMVSLLRHTVGSEDGAEGMPVLNWSRRYGDLRVVHFFGIHALQIIPLAGWYLAKNKKQVWIITFVYTALLLFFLLQAIKGIPFPGY